MDDRINHSREGIEISESSGTPALFRKRLFNPSEHIRSNRIRESVREKRANSRNRKRSTSRDPSHGNHHGSERYRTDSGSRRDVRYHSDVPDGRKFKSCDWGSQRPQYRRDHHHHDGKRFKGSGSDSNAKLACKSSATDIGGIELPEDDCERMKKSERSYRSRKYINEEGKNCGEGSSARPVWATKAVMRRAEEIQQRKLLWSKPKEENVNHQSDETSGSECTITNKPTSSARPSNLQTWNSILAAASTDSKDFDKFKRLMGMKKNESDCSEEIDSKTLEAERLRQKALYSQLDQQYSLARSITHTARGQGLGFH